MGISGERSESTACRVRFARENGVEEENDVDEGGTDEWCRLTFRWCRGRAVCLNDAGFVHEADRDDELAGVRCGCPIENGRTARADGRMEGRRVSENHKRRPRRSAVI